MRQRITYLQEPNDSLDPKTLEVGKAYIKTKEVKGVKAAREEKITFAIDELPRELKELLQGSHEVYIRWVSEAPYQSRAPLVSRLSPGLHVFYTPQRGSNNTNQICTTLKRAFGEVDCASPQESFTTLPTERFSHSTATQYYSPLPPMQHFIAYLTDTLCPAPGTPARFSCISRVQALTEASYFDLNYDTLSHVLVLTTFSAPRVYNLDIENPSPSNSRLEVGILSVEKALHVEELSLGGFLTVVGEDTKPSPTLFSFAARHHPLQDTFTSEFLVPTGLHPNLQVRISSSNPPLDDRSCKIHAHLTLPRSIFVDKYQLVDPLFLASQNLSSLHYITTPVDLEAPEYAMSIWGSSVLLELAPPSRSTKEWTAQIPLHLRYLAPSNSSGYRDLTVPCPVLFWACTADDGTKFPNNPFDRVNLGYDGLFGPRTLFYHLNPMPAVGGDGKLVSAVKVPVLDLREAGWVEMGTVIGVGVGFVMVVGCLWWVWMGGAWHTQNSIVEEKEKKTK